ncbi:MAG: hypothetical protein KGI27_14145 [Thaumarchaeota archaeon]|nr:hypothetical protein [Nitrososphaerota archaeon]
MRQSDQYTVRLDLTDDERRNLRVMAARLDLTIGAIVTELVRRELSETEKVARQSERGAGQ